MAVICGIDFSEPSARAAQVAAQLAVRKRTELELLHAHPEGPEEDEARKGAWRRATAQLDEAATELRRLGGHVRASLAVGRPDELLPQNAEASKAELVVIGALGRRPPSRWTLGSTAERTAQTSAVPVLVVRDSRPFSAWLHGDRTLRVVVATDVTDVCEPAIRWASSLRDLGPVDLTVLHVYSPPEAQRRLGLPVAASLFDRNPEIEEALARALTHRVWGPGGPGSVKIEVRPGTGRTGDHLASHAEELRADLLVVGNHRREGLERLWHGSVSQNALHAAHVSVAVVPGHHGASARKPRRLLVGVDFTSASEQAAQQAFAMATYGCTVWLVHVRARGGHQPEVPLLRQQLSRLVPFDAERAGITVDTQVVDGDEPAQAIVQCAKQADADVILMGTRALGRLEGAILGSVSQAVLAAADRPVMLVPAAER